MSLNLLEYDNVFLENQIYKAVMVKLISHIYEVMRVTASMILLFMLLSCQLKNTKDNFWWPSQSSPAGIVTSLKGSTHGQNALAYSLAGLVAQAQKQGELDELIWHESEGEYDVWYEKFIQRTGAEERGEYDVWSLLARYNYLVKGYILYNPVLDSASSSKLDFSYNIATSFAGIEQAVIITPEMEPILQELGYKLILDARNIPEEEFLHKMKVHAGKNIIFTMHPSFHNNRDLAIANKAIVTYGMNEITIKSMALINPISPVVGWNQGSEDDFTLLPTTHGLFNTASDWCDNLLVLSSDALHSQIKKIKSLDPQTIDFDDGKHFHSFILSDGDNMQWSIGSFIKNESYWGNQIHGEFPVGFTSCPVNLSMMAPDVLDEMVKTQPSGTTIIEYGGGYYYPDFYADVFGDEKKEVLRAFAKKINFNMQRTGAKVFGFICIDLNSTQAMEAYQIFAEEIKELVGMYAVQYAPYHGGHGKIFWVKNKKGTNIPVVTAQYSLWQGLDFEGGGDIDKIAGYINTSIRNTEETMGWTIVHAWSKFENPIKPGHYESGIGPIKWCINQLSDDIRIVSPEELLWRIRMKEHPEETMLIFEEKNKFIN